MTALSHEGLLALEDRRRQCMLDADVDGLESLLADDLVYVHSSGVVDGKSSYLGHLRQGHLRYRRIDLDVLQFRRMEGVATVHGRMRADIEIVGQARAVRTLFLTVWARQADGLWRLSDHQGTPCAD